MFISWSATHGAIWPKSGNRFLCTSSQPRPFNADGQWIHSSVVDDGECYAGCCDRYRCADCGVTWTDDGGHA